MHQNTQKNRYERELYNKINDFRKELDIFSLSSCAVKEFVALNPEYSNEFEVVLKNSILGNICAWRNYETACVYHEAIQISIND